MATPAGSRADGRRRRDDPRPAVDYDVIAQNISTSGQRGTSGLRSAAAAGPRPRRPSSARLRIPSVKIPVVIFVVEPDQLIQRVRIRVIRVVRTVLGVEWKGLRGGRAWKKSVVASGAVWKWKTRGGGHG